ncbi:MAG: VOC family protein [Armatimonadetes bacterium]|nr:VOC family protein [Armatimonadota bacterium]
MATKVDSKVGVSLIDHVAIAVPQGQLDAHVALYERIGFREIHREEVYGGDQVREVLLQVGDSGNLIQLLEPLSADSPVAKQVEKQGGRPGMAHVAFRVENIQETFDALKSDGFQIIDPAPRAGSRGTTVFFMHPKSHSTDGALGVLYEFVQENDHETT